jgi:hypothetical protein
VHPRLFIAGALLAALLAAGAVKAQDGTVAAALEVDRTVVALDKQIRLAVTVSAPEDTTIDFKPVRDSVGPFELIYQSEGAVEPLGDGRARWQRIYRIKPRQVGVQTIPPFLIAAKAAGETSATDVSSAPLDIFVTPPFVVGDNVRSPRTIAPAVNAPPPPLPWPWLAGGAVFLVLLVMAVTVMVRRRTGIAEPGAPSLPAHAVALTALAQIRHQGLIEERQSAEFHLRLSQILRSYVVWRFDASALTQTTEEFVAATAYIEPLSGERGDMVTRLLAHCDLAKFAGWISAPTAMAEALENAEYFVNESANSSIFAPRGASLETS